jgi:hypothetical protein
MISGSGQEAKNSVRFAFVQMGFTPRQVSTFLTGYEGCNKLKRAGRLRPDSHSPQEETFRVGTVPMGAAQFGVVRLRIQ